MSSWSKAYVQVANISADKESHSWFTLWVTNDLDKAESNARKRSSENPNMVFRAAWSDRSESTDYDHYSYRSYNVGYRCVYYLNGEKESFLQPERFIKDNFPRYDGKLGTDSVEWREYITAWILELLKKSGQVAWQIREERWGILNYSLPEDDVNSYGWHKPRNGMDETTIVAAHKRLSDKRSKWGCVVGEVLTRVTYTNSDTGESFVEYWCDHAGIDLEAVNKYIARRLDTIKWRSQRIIDGGSLVVNGNHVYLDNSLRDAFATVGLDNASKYFNKLQLQLAAVSEVGQLNDDQRERLNRVVELMREAGEILGETK